MTQDSTDDLTPDRNAVDGPQTAAEVAAAELASRLNKSEAELADTKDKLLRALPRPKISAGAPSATPKMRANTRRAISPRTCSTSPTICAARWAALDPASLQDERAKALVEGVAATERALLAALERHGIKRIEPEIGERFDPNSHEAMFEVPNTGKPGGSVVQVVQAGYRMHDRLLRPAMVGVAKAGANSGPTIDQTV